jgi:F-type H+-transporting ATPase subunit b
MGHFDPGLFLWALATFAGLMLLLSRFAFKPLREMLQRREETIRAAIQQAEAAREEARRLLEQQQAGIAEARQQAREAIEEGHRIVAGIKQEAAEAGRQQTELLLERARTEIENETRKSLDDLKGTVAALSVRIARQIIRENLDEKRHEELADQFIERLKKNRHDPRKP